MAQNIVVDGGHVHHDHGGGHDGDERGRDALGINKTTSLTPTSPVSTLSTVPAATDFNTQTPTISTTQTQKNEKGGVLTLGPGPNVGGHTGSNNIYTPSSPTVPIGVLIGSVLVPSPLLLPRQAVEPYIFSNANAVRENMTSTAMQQQQRRSIGKGGQRNPAVGLFSLPNRSMDLESGQRANGGTGRRAIDAGPVANNAEHEDDIESLSTLPPEYRDVFTTSRFPTVSSRS